MTNRYNLYRTGDSDPPFRVPAPRPRRILLVEDHADTAKAFAALLRYGGHIVTTASTLAEANRLCETGEFDLLIADIALPDGDAWGLPRKARECGGMDAIAISAYSDDEHIRRGFESGFREYIVKPLVIDKLWAAMEARTDGRPGSSPGRGGEAIR